MIKDNKLEIISSNEDFDTWITKNYVSKELQPLLKNASILIVPFERFKDYNSPTFPSGTADFYQYALEKLPKEYSIEIGINEDLYQELSLHSNSQNVGKFVVGVIVLPIFVNLVSSYFYDKLRQEDTKPVIQQVIIDNSIHIENKQIVEKKEPKKFMQKSYIKFSVTVVDTIKGRSKEIHYEGPANEVKNIIEQANKFISDDN